MSRSQAQDEWPNLTGFDASEIEGLRDEDFESLDDPYIRSLLSLSMVAPERELERTANEAPSATLLEIQAQPSKFRFHILKQSGYVRHVVKVRAGVGLRNDVPFFYQVLLEDESGTKATVLSIDVPDVWLVQSELNEAVSYAGLFVGALTEPLGSETPECLFVAKQLKWNASQRTNLELSQSHKLLSDNGFDLGLFDVVTKFDRQPMSGEEGAAFYDLLSAVEKISEQERTHQNVASESQNRRGVDLFNLLRQPTNRAGEFVRIQGKVVNVTPVFAGTDGDKPRYFQMDLSVPIGQKRISIDGPNGEKLVFRNRFPATLAVPKLLAEIPDLKGETIVAHGFMYRFWNYTSIFSEQNQSSSGQYSPLIFVDRIETIARIPDQTTWVVPSLLIGLLVFVVGLAIFIGRGDGQLRASRRCQRLPAEIFVDQPKETEATDDLSP